MVDVSCKHRVPETGNVHQSAAPRFGSDPGLSVRFVGKLIHSRPGKQISPDSEDITGCGGILAGGCAYRLNAAESPIVIDVRWQSFPCFFHDREILAPVEKMVID